MNFHGLSEKLEPIRLLKEDIRRTQLSLSQTQMKDNQASMNLTKLKIAVLQMSTNPTRNHQETKWKLLSMQGNVIEDIGARRGFVKFF